MTWDVLVGDCIDLMQTLTSDSVDAVVCDPPYDLLSVSRNGSGRSNEPDNPYGRHGSQGGFMGMTWDGTGVAFSPATWAQVLRVLKPGGHLLAFGGTRTSHRMVCAIEDAGFEIRDSLVWLYGSGFPKSLDVSKAMDKAAGIEREDKFEGSFERRAGPTGNRRCDVCGNWLVSGTPCKCPRPQDEPQSDLAKQWDGWGTALKPAHEPIVLARKPLSGTVAANVTRYGTGALNIDGTRIPSNGEHKRPYQPTTNERNVYGAQSGFQPSNSAGRWPANILFDEEAAAMLDAQSGESQSRTGIPRSGRNGDGWGMTQTGTEYTDSGGASRFFYCSKASRAEREEGLSHLPTQTRNRVNPGGIEHDPKWAPIQVKNHHPTVKPIDLMRWLITLVTPPAGLVLDPFTGSGSTGVAAVKGGWSFLGIEQDEGYADIARARIAHAVPHQIALF